MVRIPEHWVVGIVFLAFFLLTYPSILLIADELAYFEQAYALLKGGFYLEEELFRPKHYPLGTALWSAAFMGLLGKKAVFLGGAIALLGAFGVTYYSLRQQGLPDYWAVLYFIYPPALLLSRQVMSELPSLLVSAVFFVLFFRSRRSYGVLGLLAGLSLLFRETSILLFAPFLFSLFWKEPQGRLGLTLGFLLGISLRLTSSYLAYGDVFFIKDPGAGFSLAALPVNLSLYLLALLVFVPAGLIAVIRYRGANYRALQLAVVLFLLLHLLYEYSGCRESGFRCLILGPRFFIPSLPLFVQALAHTRLWENWFGARHWRYLLLGSSLVIIPAGHIAAGAYGKAQQKVVDQLYRHPAAVNFVDRDGYVYKYISHLYGDLNYRPVRLIPEEAPLKEPFYVHFFGRADRPVTMEIPETFYQLVRENAFEIRDSAVVEAPGKVRLWSYELLKRTR